MISKTDLQLLGADSREVRASQSEALSLLSWSLLIGNKQRAELIQVLSCHFTAKIANTRGGEGPAQLSCCSSRNVYADRFLVVSPSHDPPHTSLHYPSSVHTHDITSVIITLASDPPSGCVRWERCVVLPPWLVMPPVTPWQRSEWDCETVRLVHWDLTVDMRMLPR